MPKMHADEVDTNASLVGRLVEAQFPQWAGLPIEPVLSSGTDNATFRLGDEMAARLPRTQGATSRLEKEYAWLPRFAGLLPLAIPVPLARGLPAEGYPFDWCIYPWLEGEIASINRIVDPAQAATDLAQFVAALQRVDSTDGPPPGQHNAFRGVPLAARDAAVRATIPALPDDIDRAAVTVAWEAALDAAEWSYAPVWIHGDLDARNLLLRNGRLCAVIDFGCLGVGDPACDMMVAWKMLSADERSLFRNTLSVDEETWARARGWALSQAVIALSYYTLETNRVLVQEARRWMSEVFANDAG